MSTIGAFAVPEHRFFQVDLDAINSYLKGQGYYFTRIKNVNLSSLVTYKEDNSLVDLLIEIDTGHKLYADEIIIIGNHKTRKLLIERDNTQFHASNHAKKLEKERIFLDIKITKQ